MRLASIIGAIGVAACLSAVVPVTAEANSTSPYTRMQKIRKQGVMHNHRAMYHHHRSMMMHHRRHMMMR